MARQRRILAEGQMRVGWEEPAIKVASVDATQKQITFGAGLDAGIGDKYHRPAGTGKEPYYAINMVEEINQPGEWAVDFNSKILYFWPPDDLTKSEIMVTQLAAPLVSLDHTAHVAMLRLTFEYSLGDGIAVSAGSDDLVAGCTLRYLAGNAIDMDGMHNGVQSCDIYQVGQGCVVLKGGDRLQLTPSNSYVINNLMHHYGVLKRSIQRRGGHRVVQ